MENISNSVKFDRVHITTKQLKFNGPDCSNGRRKICVEGRMVTEPWIELSPQTIEFGNVCSLCADRVGDLDLFVIIDYIPKHKDRYTTMENIGKGKLRVIFPRMRYIGDKIWLGDDKLLRSENKDMEVDPDFDVTAFVPKTEGLYRVHEIDMSKISTGTYILCHNMFTINHLDAPLGWF